MSQASAAGPVHILLSTYNGAAFLPAQLRSFTTQDDPNWVLHWRDDGSSDDTAAIMRAFAATCPPGRCVESPGSGPHLGATTSFLTLLAENIEASAVAFADQDDVWLPQKLKRAAAALRQAGDKPMLYCARQWLVDAQLQNRRLSVAHGKAPGFPACLTQNIANGNTLVMNQAAVRLVTAVPAPEGTVHDWWSYIVVSACGGQVVFDDEPTVLYRLHKKNLIGAARPLPGRALAALQRGPAIFMTMMRRHADTLAAAPHLLSPEARQSLRVIRSGLHGGMRSRARALLCEGFRRRTWLENILFGYWFLGDRARVRGLLRQSEPAGALHQNQGNAD